MQFCLLAVVLVSFPAGAGDAAIHVTLEGKWAGTAPDGTKVTYEFSPDGWVTWDVAEENFRKEAPEGLKGRYTIRVADPVWLVDIGEFNHPKFKRFAFRGIIAVLDAKSFRMEGRPDRRPTAFGPEAIVFRAEGK